MLNLCLLTGNLGADPEMKYTNEGTPIANFNLAFRPGKEKTGWMRVTCFNRLAELAEKHLHKGARVTAVGCLDQDKWESNGETKTAYKLIAHSIEFIKTDGRGFEEGKNHDETPF